MEIIYRYGYKFYSVPKNTIIYRGDLSQTLMNYPLRDIEFFTTEYSIAILYGITTHYSCNDNILLYAMDDIKNIENLYDVADEETKKQRNTLLVHLDIQMNLLEIVQDKVIQSDYEIIKLICSLRLDGYGASEIIHNNRRFHSEIALYNM